MLRTKLETNVHASHLPGVYYNQHVVKWDALGHERELPPESAFERLIDDLLHRYPNLDLTELGSPKRAIGLVECRDGIDQAVIIAHQIRLRILPRSSVIKIKRRERLSKGADLGRHTKVNGKRYIDLMDDMLRVFASGEWMSSDIARVEMAEAWSPATVSRNLSTLKKRGFIENRKGKGDRFQQWRWRLTDRGRKHLEGIGHYAMARE